MGFKERRHRFVRAVQNHLDVIVPSLPRIFQERCHLNFIEARQAVSQPIESGAQWRPPFLVPIAMSARIAPAVGAPALDAVDTAPRAIRDNFDDMVRRKLLQETARNSSIRPACLSRCNGEHRKEPFLHNGDDGHNFRRRWQYARVVAKSSYPKSHSTGDRRIAGHHSAVLQMPRSEKSGHRRKKR